MRLILLSYFWSILTLMRSIVLYILLFFPILMMGQAQPCKVDDWIIQPKTEEQFKQFKALLHHQQSTPHLRNRTVVYFPVVIHVVATASNRPVSLAQAIQQLDVLNDDFAGLGENVNRLEEEFKSLVGDAQMQFCLATTDPDGQPTSGITFTSTTVNNIALQTGPGGRVAIHYDQLGGKTGWDPSRYINIWIGEYGGILGSASFPGMAPYPEQIGIVIDPQYFGAIGEAGNSGFYGHGHTLTHEMGHFFGLRHIWGSGLDINCEDSDDIDDTPNSGGPYYGCPTGTQSSCGSNDMYQNFMDLSDDRCLAAFTKGQVDFMQAVQEIYYPDLPVEGGCAVYTDTFSIWYNNLVWSHDASANTYVVYNAESWTESKRIMVYAADGRIILDAPWDDQLSYLLDMSSVASGIYFVSIGNDENHFVKTIVSY